ncbi:hypothetical protein NHX12_027783 [Muraenolepis orangiensis]|uniref:Uncharacterized protein n=1 Tax=Muraenolepis orangiensis TaxID=630683 RepID=A0A9Q0IP65_9TELE|nr:hypothetical protein NHX12_027783 [Muraenolepis orangiensis]
MRSSIACVAASGSRGFRVDGGQNLSAGSPTPYPLQQAVMDPPVLQPDRRTRGKMEFFQTFLTTSSYRQVHRRGDVPMRNTSGTLLALFPTLVFVV